MRREKLIEKMIQKAKAISGANAKNYSKDKENELWRMASDNDIFMCEHFDDNNNLDGFYIEDDYFITVEA